MGKRKKGLRSSSITQPTQERSELSQILQEISRPAKLVDMHRRIALFKRALDLQPTENTQLWAALQGELGICLSQSPLGNRADNIEMAIEHCHQAMRVYTEKDFPPDWAMTENNLAAAYKDRIRGNKSENIEHAIEHYQQTLKVYTEKDFPAEWALIQNNLAVAYSDRIRGDRSENIEQAIHHYDQALKVLTARDFPRQCRKTAYGLGNLCMEDGRMSGAIKAYSTGIEAAEELYRASLFQASREAELAETGDLYRWAGYALAMSGETLREAVASLERGRTRGLGDALARDRADLERVRAKDKEAYELYSQAVQELQSLESQERAGATGEEKVLSARDLMMQARASLDGGSG